MNLKKNLLLILMLLCVFSINACDKEEEKGDEFVIKDVDLTNSIQVDDNNLVFYEIFTGAFSDSNGDGIGDLQGIINRLDYLNDGNPNSGKSLGIEGIWLTPIFKSPSYHKYDVADYYTIDPEFGDMDDLKQLITECHNRGIKLILDLVLNHTSLQNEWFLNFKNAHQAKDSSDPYYDFYSYITKGQIIGSGKYTFISGTEDSYECNFSNDMPELNYNNEKVREEVLKIAKYYIDMGIDGFRLDAAKYIYYGDDQKSAEFWEWFTTELRKIKPDVYLVGEVWSNDSATDIYVEHGLNCFNFTMSQFEGKISSAARISSVTGYVNYVKKYIDRINNLNSGAMLTTFIANHDTDRAAGYLQLNGQAQMAANIYILGPGSPFIYYGEEIGMKGSRGSESTDANRRLAMLWGDGDTVKDPIGTTYVSNLQINGTVVEHKLNSESLYNHYKRVIMIRNANPEIARGEYKPLNSEISKLGGFISTYNGKTVCVIHNTSLEEMSVDLTTLTEIEFKNLSAFVGMNSASLNGNILTIGGQTSVVLR